MEPFESLFIIRRCFPKMKKNLLVKNLKIKTKWDYSKNMGYTTISYVKNGLKVKFFGKYENGEQEFDIYGKFDINMDYFDITQETLINENIESLLFLKELCKRYSLKKIINNTIVYN
tara:strand:- start:320 stop:670 length:351 start_codon:yes stop_codon:yes gene_type:complete